MRVPKGSFLHIWGHFYFKSDNVYKYQKVPYLRRHFYSERDNACSRGQKCDHEGTLELEDGQGVGGLGGAVGTKKNAGCVNEQYFFS